MRHQNQRRRGEEGQTAQSTTLVAVALKHLDFVRTQSVRAVIKAPVGPTSEHFTGYMMNVMSPLSLFDRVTGCLLGGAVGDALGAAVEFSDIVEIRERYGPEGIQDYAPAYGRVGAITDDTQMTLFTAEGLIRAWIRQQSRGICAAPSVVSHAYLRWLLTQGEEPQVRKVGTDGWLYGVAALHSRRAPGNTCLSALQAASDFGSPPVAANDSKGCGGVMRVAPVGLFAAVGDDAAVFSLASKVAALTHGHPSGFLAAGHFATMIAALTRGEQLNAAIEIATTELRKHQGHEEIIRAVDAARTFAAAGPPDSEALARLGGGWVAEEALGIAVCCALVAEGFSDGVRLAVNHSGDSDSTGAMTGNLLGAQLGVASIPVHWLKNLELCDEIDRIACDLCRFSTAEGFSAEDFAAYPGW